MLGHPKLIKGPEVAADNTESQIVAESLPDNTRAETAVGVVVGEVDVAMLLKASPLLLIEEPSDKCLGVFSREDGSVLPHRKERAEASAGGGA